MTASNLEPTGVGGGVLDEYQDEVGFLMLGLAQLVSIFGIWFGSWPTAFDMGATVGQGLAIFFFAAGAVGFYLAFQALSHTG